MHATVKYLLAALAALSVGGCAAPTAATTTAAATPAPGCQDAWVALVERAGIAPADRVWAVGVADQYPELGASWDEFVDNCPADAHFDAALADVVERGTGHLVSPSGTDPGCQAAWVAMLDGKVRASGLSNETLHLVNVRPGWPELGETWREFQVTCPRGEYLPGAFEAHMRAAADKSGLTE